MLPVVAELVRRGNVVRFYSFREFEAKIRAAGAEFVSCEELLPAISEQEAARLKRVSTTEMTIQDIRMTLNLDGFLDAEFKDFRPDVVFTDSVCFWGKLNAWKHNVPVVVSTSTFAFNKMSSQYMKYSAAEMAGMIFGITRIAKELKRLEPYGYHVKNPLSLVQSDNVTDSVVYTSRRYQPYGESFTDHYLFAGPSVFSKAVPDKKKERPLVYVSMGTVINDRPDFYAKCIAALKDEGVDVIISCGNTMDRSSLEPLPECVQVFPSVDQLEVLAKADVFLTHCGMNSVSESLYMATPMVLYPQTGEQQAVARRAAEMHAGVPLKDDSVEGIRAAVREVLRNPAYREGAGACSEDFRSCPGPAGAAEFIETAPHVSDDKGLMGELDAAVKRFRPVYRLFAVAIAALVWLLLGRRFVWIVGVAAGVLSSFVDRIVQNRKYAALVEKRKTQRA